MDSPTIRTKGTCFYISLGETKYSEHSMDYSLPKTICKDITAEKGIALTSFNLMFCGFSFHCVFHLLAFLISVDTYSLLSSQR